MKTLTITADDAVIDAYVEAFCKRNRYALTNPDGKPNPEAPVDFVTRTLAVNVGSDALMHLVQKKSAEVMAEAKKSVKLDTSTLKVEISKV